MHWIRMMLTVPIQASLFIGFMCAVNSSSGTAVFFKTVSMVLLILTTIMFFMYLCNVPNVHSGAPWLNVEFFAYGGGAVLIAIPSILIIFSGEVQLFVAGVSIYSLEQFSDILFDDNFLQLN